MTEMKIIARIRTELPEKFGVPRQSGLVPQLRGRVVFEPGYRNPDAVRGLEDFSHIWLIWQFSQAVREDWSPTVRPPRLGGNRRMGVFATRSPFRPNAMGLSSVQLDRVELDPQLGPVLHVRGADLMDGTPIFRHQALSGLYRQPSPGHRRIHRRPGPRRRRWTVPGRCWSVSRRTAGRGFWACWPEIPGPAIRRTPSGLCRPGLCRYNIRFTVDGDRLTMVDVEEAR